VALILVTLTLSLNIQPINAEAEGYANIQSNSNTIHVVNQTTACTDIGDYYYSNITAAVNNASSGDTIIVCPGTYNESVDVFNKSLTIKSESGDPTDTIVNASGKDNGFEVDGQYLYHYVNITGFTITGAPPPKHGIVLLKTDYANISNNIISDNARGIKIGHSSYNTIENNNVTSNNNWGIFLYNSSYNTIRYNNVSNNNEYGIYLDDSGGSCSCLGNTISYNNIFNNTQYDLYNIQSNAITAEYNWWGSTNNVTIDSNIYDDDEGSYGEVDFYPFLNSPYPNRPPTIDSRYPSTNPNINEEQSQVFNITYSDPDLDSVTVQWYLNSTPTGTNDNYTFTANYTSAGTYNVTVVIDDSEFTDSTQWNMTVTNVNRPPTIDTFTPADTTPDVDEGQNLEFTHTSSDPDTDPLSYSWLLDDVEKSADQNWTYSPDFNAAGPHNVTLVVSDGNLTDSQEWAVTVNDVNRAPVIDTYYPPTNPSITEEQSQVFNITYSDPDLDSVTVQWYLNSTPTGTNDNYTFTANYTSAGTYNVTVVISDNGLTDFQQWNMTVINVNRPPTAPIVNVTPESPVTTDDLVCTITTNSTDPDNDTITYYYEWYKNYILQTDYTTDKVPSSATAKGEVWKCVVTPNDGTEDGPTDQDEVMIGNGGGVGGFYTINPAIESNFLNPTITNEPESWNICIPLALVATATITVNIVRQMRRTNTSIRKKRRKNRNITILVVGFIILCLIVAGFIYSQSQSTPKTEPTFKAGIIDHLSETHPNEQFVETCTTMLRKSGYEVSYHKYDEINVDFFRRLPSMGYKIIILRVHSALGKEGPPVAFFTSEGPFNKTKYEDEWYTGQIANTTFTNDEATYFGITPEFIANTTANSYDDCIIIGMGCDTLTGIYMSTTFILKGATLYTGFNGPVSAEHTDETTICLLRHLLVFKEKLKEAVSKTMEEVGPDPDFGSYLMASYKIGTEDYVIPYKGG